MRFQKYRGLKSFRTSDWDKNENLPYDYARIFKFDNFQRTKKRVLKASDMDETHCVAPGAYVRIHITNVPAAVAGANWFISLRKNSFVQRSCVARAWH